MEGGGGEGDWGGDRRDPGAVADRLEEGRRREVTGVVRGPDELVAGALEALGQHDAERQREADDEIETDDADEQAHEPVVAARRRSDEGAGLSAARGCRVSDGRC